MAKAASGLVRADELAAVGSFAQLGALLARAVAYAGLSTRKLSTKAAADAHRYGIPFSHSVIGEMYKGRGITSQRLRLTLAMCSIADSDRELWLTAFYRLTSGGAAPAVKASSSYLALVRGRLAPQGGLRGRDDEWIRLEQFCRGEDPYLWIEADPWAGKTALLAAFALAPHSDLSVVCCFLTRTLAGHHDHHALTTAIFDQVGEHPPHPDPDIFNAVDRDTMRYHLLDLAADNAATHGRRLVLIVDGLDEDTGAPAVSTILPRTPHPNLRVIVASRSGGPLLHSLVPEHPLRSCLRHALTPWTDGHDRQRLAVEELSYIYDHSPRARTLLALVTAARGLSVRDLAELTDASLFEVRDVLEKVAARSLRANTQGVGDDTEYALAHETLQRSAEDNLGPHLVAAVDILHAWACHYQRQKWPDSTPAFLFQRYFEVVVERGCRERQVGLVLDAVRHGRLFDITGSDAAALREIRATQQRLVADSDPDLTAIARLALRRDLIMHRASALPPTIAMAWASLGAVDHAQALARLHGESHGTPAALLLLVDVLLERHDHSRARTLLDIAEQMFDRTNGIKSRLYWLIDVAEKWLAAGDPERALAAAHAAENHICGNSDGQGFFDRSHLVRAITRLAAVFAALGQHDHQTLNLTAAEVIAAAGTTNEHLTGLADLLTIAIATDDTTLASRILDTLDTMLDTATEDLPGQIVARAQVARALAEAGEHERASRLATEVRTLSAHPDIAGYDHDGALQHLARAAIGLGNYQHAQELAEHITATNRRADVISAVITLWRDCGERARAEALTEYLETMAVHCKPDDRLVLFAHLAMAKVALGDYDRAEQIGRAELVAFNPRFGPLALIWLVRHLADAGQHARAHDLMAMTEPLAYRHTPFTLPLHQIRLLIRVLSGLGETALARQLAHHTETQLRTSRSSAAVLDSIVEVWLDAGDLDRAETVSQTMPTTQQRSSALTALARAFSARGERDRAQHIAAAAGIELSASPHHSVPRSHSSEVEDALDRITAHAENTDAVIASLRGLSTRRKAQVAIAAARARAGDLAGAEKFARSLTHPETKAHALTRIASLAAPPTAHRILACAWLHGRWTIPVEALGRINLPTLRALAHDALTLDIR